ncbi:MAG: ROK family transcriptional regulator [Roseibium sp.]|nr:ROK family transcriptional regulator [Roseibium sp.]
MSLSAIVQAIASYGPISRASVAKITGLSKQTVSEIVGNLEEEGWVRTVGQTEGHIGRRAVVYEIVPDAASVASVDLGGTKIRVAICDLTGAIVSELVETTDKAGGEAVVRQVVDLVNRAAAQVTSSPTPPRVAVIGVPGVPDPVTGQIKLAPNIPGIDSIDARGLWQQSLGIEVFVENDVNLAALGEHWLTKRGDKDDLIYVSIGTGIGAGLVVGGQLHRGSSGAAGEIGYLPFGADPFEDESLKVGALERVTATQAIKNGYAKATGKTLSVPDIFDAAATGDQAALTALDEIARQVARAMAALAAVMDPTCIVVGGSVGTRDELFGGVEKYISMCFPRAVQIEKSVLGNHAALAGGTSVALSRLHLSLFTEGLKGVEIAVPPPSIDTFKVGVA